MSPSAGWKDAASSHDCSLSDGERTYFFNLAGKPKIIQEEPTVPSTFVATASGKQFGDWEPGFSQIEQRDWTGGRGQEEFWTDESKYFDARMAWTMSPGRLGPVPAWQFAEVMKWGYTNLPGAGRPGNGYDVRWRKMLNGHVLARSFTTDSNTYTATKILVWVRRRGNPTSNLTIKVFGDSSGEPADGGTLHASDTIVYTDLADTLSYLYEFDLGAGWAVSATTKYWVCVYADADDSEINHWEVGYGTGAADTCKSSSDDMVTWDTTGEQLYFRVMIAPVKRRWHFFKLDGVQYAVDEKAAGTASTLMINGWRGKATAGTSTSLTDSNQTWVADKLIGAWVRIWKGTGKGQYREITDNTATALTVATWDITPDTTSEYYVYATNEWRDITPGSGDQIDGVVKSVAVFDNIAIFAEGSGVNMLKMRFNAAASPPAHEFDDDGTNKGDVVRFAHHPTMGPVIYRGLNTDKTMGYAKVAAWATDLTFTETKDVGDEQYDITGLLFYNGQPWAFKEDSVFYALGERMQQVELGFDSMTNYYNGRAVKIWNMQAYFNWAGTLMEMYGSNVNDMGPWLNAGLPAGRKGYISCLDATHAFLIAGMDAGDSGTSSVLTYNKRGWMELFRAWTTGKRVQDVQWQSCPGTWDRLWISVGGDIVSQLFPETTLNPFREDAFPFHHEWAIETSTIDMKAARISKLFNSLAITSKNLGRSAWIELDYQVDDQIDGDDWVSVGEFRESDYQEVFLGQGDKKRIRYRLRGYSEDADAPALVIAAVIDAFARTPVKFQWIMRIPLKSLAYEGSGFSPDPDEFRAWLEVASTTAKELRLRAPIKHMDDIDVVVEPPRTSMRLIDRIKGLWTGTIVLVVRQK